MTVLSLGIKQIDVFDFVKLRDELSGGVVTGGDGCTIRDGEAMGICC